MTTNDPLRKSPREWEPSDLEAVVQLALAEGDSLELKVAVPEKSGAKTTWRASRDLSDYSVRSLLSEMVAFANGRGGWLLLGVREGGIHPARAIGLAALPACGDLADRLAKQARDLIEPQVPVLDVVPVPASESGDGFVVARVGRSHRAPHRLRIDRECYVRRGDRSEKMTMEEIQDLTILVSRGAAALGSAVANRSEEALAWIKSLERPGVRTAGLFSIGEPVWPLALPLTHGDEGTFPLLRAIDAKVGGESKGWDCPLKSSDETPVLRGRSRGYAHEGQGGFQVVREDGSVGIRAAWTVEGASLWFGWIPWAIANTLRMVDAARQGAGSPSAEFAIHWGLYDSTGVVDLLGHYAHRPAFAPIPTFPTLAYRDRASRDELVRQAAKDAWNALGRRGWEGPIEIRWPEG